MTIDYDSDVDDDDMCEKDGDVYDPGADVGGGGGG